ncbi:MAG TPA: GAF domain-containing protein [Aggregatilinea sp.]|uniref:GAF domain-containing protein n=1 Tax=Aggregatilinea sp. TaxID=2806333 RepID=UPI002C5080A8|nr:GAF domain-containing protein [Aggregatilinea sp.]HML22317.1 GAF domain-containing protein [Aggregatilinea sp.]
MLHKLSIRAQLLIIIFLALFFVTASITVANIVQVRSALIDAQRTRGQSLTGSVYLTVQLADRDTPSFAEIPDMLARLQTFVRQNDDMEFVAVVSPRGLVLAHSDTQYIGQTVDELADLPLDETVRGDVPGFNTAYLTTVQFESPIERLPGAFDVVIGSSAAPVDDELIGTVLVSAGIGLATLVLISIASLFFVQAAITVPVRRLEVGARMFGRGDFDYRVTPEGSLELRELGTRFNQMADDLKRYRQEVQDASELLEVRLEERTRALSTVNDVSVQIATLLNVSDLLQSVSDLVKENFGLYHAHVYLLDTHNENLVLAAGAGEVGQQMVRRGHRIPLKAAQSIVARAARTRQIMLQNDVRSTPDFLPNPLLPETRAEAAVALVARDELLGVLDIQSDRAGNFDPVATPPLLSTLAQQISIALSNARLFTEVERAGRHEHALAAISDQIQGALNMDEVLEIAARELGKALRVPHTAIELQLAPEPDAGAMNN